MCGIAGYFGEGDERVLRSMNTTLAHRGPDSAGVWEKEGVGLAHRRLAIIDLSAAAAQPMHRGALTIVFNGEIYNYKELRAALMSAGVSFVTQSDTEVILALFEHEGAAAFSKLEGMFACALYDGAHDTLYLVRDRFGEKPLYWFRTDDTAVFASEPGALFAHKAVSRTVSAKGLAAYLSHDCAVSPLSLFAGISQVPPATYVVCTRKGAEEVRYWRPSFVVKELSEEDAREELDRLLEASVRRQLVSDVPLGVFLSGGIDSSLIASYAKAIAGEVHTFSIGFEEKSYDESTYAREVAVHLGTTHHEQLVSASDMQEALLQVAKRMDEPIADPALLPLHLLSSFARKEITVALSGDGSDELFLGYPTFFAEQLLAHYTSVPQVVRKLIASLVATLPVSHTYMSLDFKMRQFLRGADEQKEHVHHAWLAAFSSQEIIELLAPAYGAVAALPSVRDQMLYEEAKGAEPLTQSSWWYARSLLEVYLMKADRGSMYASLETRAPFLDRSVAEFALSLPSRMKLRYGKGKYLLRRLAEKKLPKEIAWRKKHGFGLPVGQWLRNEWRELLLTTLSKERVAQAGLCRVEVVEKYVSQHLLGTHNHAKKLYALLVLHLWHQHWIQS